jgi:hypothetical protein
MKAIGIVFLYDRKEGPPEEISKKFAGSNFASVTENLVKEGLIDLIDLKDIIDSKIIYWAGIKKDFNKVLDDKDAIGSFAWRVFKHYTEKDASEDIKSLIYDGSDVPWNFTLMTCVIYE